MFGAKVVIPATVDGNQISPTETWDAALRSLREVIRGPADLKLIVGNGIDPVPIMNTQELAAEYQIVLNERKALLDGILAGNVPDPEKACERLGSLGSRDLAIRVYSTLSQQLPPSNDAKNSVEELRDETERLIGSQLSFEPAFLRYQWVWNEFYRNRTYNKLPVPDYSYLAQLLEVGKIRDIITTNYDCYWNAILEKRISIPHVQNPCVNKDDWKLDGFLSDQSLRRNDTISLWKPHGDLRFIRFRACGEVFRLPDFMIDYFVPSYEPVQVEQLRQIHKHRGKESQIFQGAQLCDTRQHDREFHGTKEPHELFGATHFIDFVLGTRIPDLGSVISAVTEEVDSWKPPSVVMVIGFRGEEEWLRDLIVKTAERLPTLYLLAAKPEKTLDPISFPIWHALRQDQLLTGYPIREVTDDGRFHDLLFKLLVGAGASKQALWGEHESWRASGMWVESI